MYERFYELRKPPFANIPDPEFMFLSPQHEKAASILRYALMARAGFCVITGDIGTGKTTLVRHVLETHGQRLHVGLVSNTQCETFEELFRWILLAFELDYRGKDKVEMYDEFVRFLIKQLRAGSPVTLIIDEAQNLGMESLEQLRMLSNVNTEKGQPLQTILVGQPELWALLQDPRLEQFAQRISYDFYLKPLDDVAQVRGYIEHRIASAGGRDRIFEDNTFGLIHRATQGIPRLINLVCDTALVYGYGEDMRTISAAIIDQVIQDKAGSFSPIGRAATRMELDGGADDMRPSPQPGGRRRDRRRAINFSTIGGGVSRERDNE